MPPPQPEPFVPENPWLVLSLLFFVAPVAYIAWDGVHPAFAALPVIWWLWVLSNRIRGIGP